MGTRNAVALAELDRQLVERVLAKDPTVIDDIVRTYKREVYHLALQLCRDHDDAEDLVQEVFIRAWKSLDSFRGESRLSTWLHRITVNLFINTTRSKSYHARKEQDAFDEEYMTGGRGGEYSQSACSSPRKSASISSGHSESSAPHSGRRSYFGITTIFRSRKSPTKWATQKEQ